MNTLEEYKATAMALKEILDKVSTVEDVINLRKVGISEKDINSVDLGLGLDEESAQQLHEFNADHEVFGIHLNSYTSENGATIEDSIYVNTQDGIEPTLTFDIYDDAGEPVLSDVSIDTLEGFRNYLETQIENNNEGYLEPTTFNKVKLLNGSESKLSEVCEHLAMNGYTYDSNCENSIFIYDEELSYLRTILENRGLEYEVQ